jgi:hypothetical protein
MSLILVANTESCGRTEIGTCPMLKLCVTRNRLGPTLTSCCSLNWRFSDRYVNLNTSLLKMTHVNHLSSSHGSSLLRD